jgi:hypothetical protein
MALTISAIATAWTNEDRIVNPQVSAMLLPAPGLSEPVLPMPFHQIGKNVRGLYQIDPLTMLTTTQTTTASQLIELKFIDVSLRILMGG